MPRGVYVRTEEYKEKVRQGALAVGVGKWMKGRKRSPELVEKSATTLRGRKYPFKNRPARSLETRLKISESNKGKHGGDKHPNWKGGITSENQAIRQSFEYKEWRKSVFQRDNYTCTECGIKSGMGKHITFHADHIKPFAYYPDLRLDINNGRTLCIDCHKLTDSFGYKAVKLSIEQEG